MLFDLTCTVCIAQVEGRFTFAQGQDVDLRDPTDKLRDQATREAEKAALLACAGPEATGRAAAALVGKDSESGISVAAGDAGAATAGADSGGGEAVEKCETTSSDSKGGDKKDSQEDDEEFGSSAEEGEQMMAAFMSDAVEGSCEGLMVKTLYGDCSTYEPSVSEREKERVSVVDCSLLYFSGTRTMHIPIDIMRQLHEHLATL